MKQFISISCVLLMGLFVSCEHDDPKLASGTVEFSVSSQDVSGGRLKSLQAVLVTVKDANGISVLDRKKLALFKFGDQYLSEPISLTKGNFKLTEFIIVDENNAAVYATPLEGSPLAYLVNDPLPIDFSVSKDQTTKVVPQVIKVDGGTAPDFGYATFSFDIVKTFKFSIGVLAYNTSTTNFELTTSHLTITSAAETLFNKDLAAITNEVNIKDDFTSYILSVSKSGYITYQRTFTAAELKAYVGSTPLVVTLLQQSVADGLIAYYPFSGNALDATTNHYDGTPHGGALLATDRKGVANAAYSFDGIDDYISVAHTNALNLTGDFSISLWTQVSASQPDPNQLIYDILRKWNGDAEGYPFSISYLGPNQSPDPNKILYVRYDGQGCGNAPASYSTTITPGTFIHIVLVKQGNKLRHYLNNTLIQEITDTTSGSSCSVGNTADVTIGCRGNLVRFFKGKIDDIRIYNRSLSTGEVANLFAE